jgi:16S rRNA (uracil1498-N3)-methyltransferase
MNLYYLPDLQYDDIEACFTEEESAHCVRVLRQKKGEIVLITNGKGGMFQAVITVSDAKRTKAEIQSRQFLPRDSKTHLHLAVAPTKNIARYEWFLEKSCEIGIDAITPLLCLHSERQKLNIERLERVLIAAMKQSQTAVLPVLNQPCTLKNFVNQYTAEQKLICWCGEQTTKQLFDSTEKNKTSIVLIGPEGDFDLEEIFIAQKNGYIPVSLGTQRLRTETAAVVACCTMNLKNNIKKE